MFSIDGLATGIDTATIVEGLLEIQQIQIDRFNGRKQEIVDQQTAFKGLEAKLLTLQGSAGKLTRISDNALQQKTVISSDETAVKAAVSDSAVEGIYRIRVDSLARSHQVVSNAYSGEESEIAQGSYDLQVGGGTVSTVPIDDTNNTVQGLMQSINDLDLGVTASIIDDGTSGDSLHLLLSADESGASNTISLSFTPGAGGGAAELAFDLNNPVQTAADAKVFLGSGAGAIQVVSSNNQFDDLFSGVTFEAVKADADLEIELKVARDVEAAEASVTEFVESYNDVVSYVQQQARFDPETETASVLFGNRSVSTIRNALSQAVTSVVPGLDKAINRFTAIGVSITSDGKLTINQSKLSGVLNGQVEGVDLDDVLGLFSTQGESTNQNIRFVLASDPTKETEPVSADGETGGPYQVKVLKAAEKAQLSGSAIAGAITIDESNNKFTIVIDAGKSATVTLADGTYQPEEFAEHLQRLLADHKDLRNRPVTVAISDSALSITSLTFGRTSEVTIQESSSLATLGLTADSDRGLDVLGQFIVNGIVERAEGRGQLLIGRAEGEDPKGSTEGLQVRVTLTPSQVTEDITADITVTRGIASRLALAIKDMTETQGSLDVIEDEFAARIESIEQSIDRLNKVFESRQQSLLAEFARLESSVNDLQSVGSLLGSQLASLPRISV